MNIKLITPSDFNKSHFSVQDSVNIRLSANKNNGLEILQDGLFLNTSPPNRFEVYPLEVHEDVWVSGDGTKEEKEARMYMIVDKTGGFCKIHIDGKSRVIGGTRKIATIPENLPLPIALIEYQMWDGCSIWIDAKSRDIFIGNGFSFNRRYITDIIDVFI